MNRALAVLMLVACHQETTPTDKTPPGTTDSGTPQTHDTATTHDTSTTPGTTGVVRDPKFDAVAEAIQQELGPNMATGVSIAVMEHGQYTWVEGFGTADPNGTVAITPDTAFEIGSTTKQMTATLVLRDVEAGLLSLDDTVDAALPQFSLAANPEWAPASTLHELISHQGGLVDYLDWTDTADDGELAQWHYDVYGPTFWANNPAGVFWNYSNPNFTVAGLAVETHDPAGRSYPDILTQDLFQPLGMDHSFIRKADLLASGGDWSLSTGISATDYYAPPGPIPMDEVPDPASARPAGLVWSTPSDMCRWASFVVHGDSSILDDSLRAEITKPQVSTLYYGDHMSYGYGEFVWDQYPLSDGFHPLRVWEHGGNTLSFTSVLMMLPDQDVVFSILSNGYGDEWPATTEALLRAVVTPFPDPSDYAPEFDPNDLGTHVGSYFDPHNVGEVDITAGGANGLQIAMPILDQYGYTVDPDLVPISTDVWGASIDGQLLDLTFIRDPSGGQDLFIRNRSFVPARVEAADTGGTATARLAAPTRDEVAHALRAAREPLPFPLPLR